MTVLPEKEWNHWAAEATKILVSNQVEVEGYRYTRPAPSTYEHQWLWDSCFHAIVYRWLDPDMARDELLSVVAHQVQQGPDKGMIPHMTYWHGGGEDLWGIADRSLITQPPLIGVAAKLVYERTSDFELISKLYPHLCAYHEWFDDRRDPDHDDLVSLIHPWESGWDASPRWDRALGLTEPTHEQARTARVTLAERLPEYDCDCNALAQAGLFHVEPVDYNSIRAADLDALAFIAGILERKKEAAHWRARAEAVRQAVQTNNDQGASI